MPTLSGHRTRRGAGRARPAGARRDVSRRRADAGVGPRPSTRATQDATTARPAPAPRRARSCGAPTRHNPSPRRYLPRSDQAGPSRLLYGQRGPQPRPFETRCEMTRYRRPPSVMCMVHTPGHLRFEGTRPQSSRCVTRKQPPEVERRVLSHCFCVIVQPFRRALPRAEEASGSPPPRVPRRLIRKPARGKKEAEGARVGPLFARRPPGPVPTAQYDGLAEPRLIWCDDSARGHAGPAARHDGATRRGPTRPTSSTPVFPAPLGPAPDRAGIRNAPVVFPT